jgi:hypothetical protein
MDNLIGLILTALQAFLRLPQLMFDHLLVDFKAQARRRRHRALRIYKFVDL